MFVFKFHPREHCVLCQLMVMFLEDIIHFNKNIDFLTHFWRIFPFYTPENGIKFGGYDMGTLARNGLIHPHCVLWMENITLKD